MKSLLSALAVSVILVGSTAPLMAADTTTQTESPTVTPRATYEAKMKQELDEQEVRNSHKPLTEDAKAAWQGVKDGWKDVKETTDDGWSEAKSKLDDSWGSFKSKWKELTTE